MKTARFLHCSDLHLGTPFKGLSRTEEDVALALSESTYRAFDHLLAIAIEKEVDFVLVCGDLLDIEDRNLRPFLHLQRGFRRLLEHEIGVFLICGNHDPLGSISEMARFPENVLVFSADIAKWHLEKSRSGMDVALWGMSFLKRAEYRNLARLVPDCPENLLRIALLHCTVGSQEGHEPYAPCQLSDLKKAPVDYWALGHIHKRAHLLDEPVAVYSGNIQGRSFKETGPRGCYLVEVDDDFHIRPSFVETDVIRWEEIQLDVTGVPDIASFQEILYEETRKTINKVAPRGLICRIRLSGICEFYESICQQEALDEIVEELNSAIFTDGSVLLIEGMVNQAIPALDMERRKEAGDLAAFVLREAERLDLDKDFLTRPGGPLSLLFQNRRFKRLGFGLEEGELEGIVRQAEHFLIHLLDNPQK